MKNKKLRNGLNKYMYKRGYRYIDRDKDGILYMYVEKPEKGIVS